MVLRGGFGVYFDEHSGNMAETTLGQPPFAFLQFWPAAEWPATLKQPFVDRPCAAEFELSGFHAANAEWTPFVQGIDPNVKDGKT